MKILIVEDNEMNRDMLSRRLTKRGYEIVMAFDGEEGVKKATSENPDIILMDVSLPVIDGYDATKQIKSNDNTKHIPVVALTAHAMEDDKNKAFDAGCDGFETKPVNMESLLATIEKVTA